MSTDLSMRVPSSFGTFAEANSFAKRKQGAVLIRGDTGFVVWLPKGRSSLSDETPLANTAPPEAPERGQPTAQAKYPGIRTPRSGTHLVPDRTPTRMPAPPVPPSELCPHGEIASLCDVCWIKKTGGPLR